MVAPVDQQPNEPNRFERAVGLFRQAVRESPQPTEPIPSGGFLDIRRSPVVRAGRGGVARVQRAGRAGARRGREIAREAPVAARQALRVRGTGGIDEVLVQRFLTAVERQQEMVSSLGGPESERAAEKLVEINQSLQTLADPKSEANDETLKKFESLLREERETRAELAEAILDSGRQLSESQREAFKTITEDTLAGRLSKQAEEVQKSRREGRGAIGVAQRGVESGFAQTAIQTAGGAVFGPLFNIIDELTGLSRGIQRGVSGGLGALTRGREKQAEQIRERTGQIGEVAARSLQDGGLPSPPEERKPRQQEERPRRDLFGRGQETDKDGNPVVAAVTALKGVTESGFDRVEKTFKSGLKMLTERGEPKEQGDRFLRRKQDLEAEARAVVPASVTKSREIDRRGRSLPPRDEKGRFTKRAAGTGGLASVLSTEINELEAAGMQSREKEINELQESNKKTFSEGLDALREQDENQFEQSRLDARRQTEPLKDAAKATKDEKTRMQQDRQQGEGKGGDGFMDEILGGLIGGAVLGKFKGLAKGAGGLLKKGGAKGFRGLGGLAKIAGRSRLGTALAGTAVGGAAIKGAGRLKSGVGAAKGPLAKLFGKEAAETAGKQGLKTLAAKGGAKAAGKGLAKGGAKSLVKKIPLVGLLAGGAFAASRLARGDVAGAGLELASGAASTLPGLGTAASVGLDAALIGRDIKKATEDKGIAGLEFERAAKGQQASRAEKQEIIKRVQSLGLPGDEGALLQGKLFRASPQERKNFFEQTGGMPSIPQTAAKNQRPVQNIPNPPSDPGIKVATSSQQALNPSPQDSLRANQFTVNRADHDINQKTMASKMSLPFMIDHLGLVLISSGR